MIRESSVVGNSPGSDGLTREGVTAFRLTLKLPADVKAVAWYAGRDTTVAPLFPRSGKYVLTMGENLEGDNARAASCTVTFSENEGR